LHENFSNKEEKKKKWRIKSLIDERLDFFQRWRFEEREAKKFS